MIFVLFVFCFEENFLDWVIGSLVEGWRVVRVLVVLRGCFLEFLEDIGV